jgi:hypothetical protein
MNDKIKASEVKPFWTPKTPPVREQCKTCPFGPNAHLLNDHVAALESAKASADMGLDFHCHKTVYKGVLQPTVRPSKQPKHNWHTCAGAVAYKQNKEVEARKRMLREQGRLIEDV